MKGIWDDWLLPYLVRTKMTHLLCFVVVVVVVVFFFFFFFFFSKLFCV
jgi:hypothetical protein